MNKEHKDVVTIFSEIQKARSDAILENQNKELSRIINIFHKAQKQNAELEDAIDKFLNFCKGTENLADDEFI